MRRAEPPVQYLVGTPKRRLTRLEQSLLSKPWREARPGVKVKLLPEDGELYVYAESLDRRGGDTSNRRSSWIDRHTWLLAIVSHGHLSSSARDGSCRLVDGCHGARAEGGRAD